MSVRGGHLITAAMINPDTSMTDVCWLLAYVASDIPEHAVRRALKRLQERVAVRSNSNPQPEEARR